MISASIRQLSDRDRLNIRLVSLLALFLNQICQSLADLVAAENLNEVLKRNTEVAWVVLPLAFGIQGLKELDCEIRVGRKTKANEWLDDLVGLELT